MDNNESHRPQQLTPLANDVNKQYLNLQPYAALGQHIMGSPVCEINIIDTYYQDAIPHNVDEAVYKDIVCYNAIRKNGKIYEIEDLTNNKHYKNHSYVKSSPYFQYYCSAKLTNKNGNDIGSIYVLDTKSKRVSPDQKEQLRQLALLVMNAIEYESRENRIASELNAVKNSFHKLTHDVRSPISGIAGISGLLIEEDHVEFPAQELTMIKESAETILDMIDKVLEDIDVATHNGEQEKHKKYRFGNIVEQLKRLFHPPSKAKGISLAFVNQVDTGLKVSQSFALKLLQITSNLLANAIKFTPQNGAIEVTITQKTDKNKNILYITVMDNGQGMTTDQIAAFNNGIAVTRSVGTNGEQSFGRGFTYIKQVIAQAGGTISVKAEENNGTQFLVSLPILPVDSFSKLLSSLQESITKPTNNGIK